MWRWSGRERRSSRKVWPKLWAGLYARRFAHQLAGVKPAPQLLQMVRKLASGRSLDAGHLTRAKKVR